MMLVNVIDVHERPIDDVRRVQPRACCGAGERMTAGTAIRVVRVTCEEDLAPVFEDDVGHYALRVVESLAFREAEGLPEPFGRARRVLVREHRYESLFGHRLLPPYSCV